RSAIGYNQSRDYREEIQSLDDLCPEDTTGQTRPREFHPAPAQGFHGEGSQLGEAGGNSLASARLQHAAGRGEQGVRRAAVESWLHRGRLVEKHGAEPRAPAAQAESAGRSRKHVAA